MIKTYVLCLFGLMMIMIHQTVAQTACAAEANFQGCKTIQETRLSGCGPVDYACQCTAHKLIQECYNLCPGYAVDASIHDGTVQSICGAVPTTSSSLPLQSATSILPLPSSSSTVQSPSASAASSTPTQQHSGASLFQVHLPLVVGLIIGATICMLGIY